MTIDFCAEPTGCTLLLVTDREPVESPVAPQPLVLVDAPAERLVTQDEFNVAAEPGAFVAFAGGRYRLATATEVLVLDVELVVA